MRLTTTTTAVHAGRGDRRALGVHALPLDLSTTNPLNSSGMGGPHRLPADFGPVGAFDLLPEQLVNAALVLLA